MREMKNQNIIKHFGNTTYLVIVSPMLYAEGKHGVFILLLHQTRKLCRTEVLYRALQLRCSGQRQKKRAV
jgi:hypothetical protein